MKAILISVIVIHVILCAIAILLTIFKKLRLRPMALTYLILVPIFGPVSILFLHIHKLRGGEDAEVNVSKFRVEADIYRSIGFSTDEDEDVVSLEEAMILNDSNTRRSLIMDLVKENVVPLEEALTLSTSNVRRKLIMDVLNSDTAAFYGLLEQARLNDDVEVVHFATTAMSELNKQYDLELEHFRKLDEAEPENAEMLYEYCGCMKSFLELEIIKGQMLEMRRAQYIDLLKRLIALEPAPDSYCDLAEQLMLADRFDEAKSTFDDMFERYPENENVWILYIEYFVRLGDGAEVKKQVEEALREHIYFSSATYERLSFWLEKSGSK